MRTNKTRVMNFKNWNESVTSLKGYELDRILDKISDKKTLTPAEDRFLKIFNTSSEDYYSDFSYLTKNDVFEKVKSILDGNRKVICDLYHKNKVGIEIKSVYNGFEDESCCIVLIDGERIELRDNHLYNLLYDIKNDEYSLQSQDEYYEKLPIKNDL